MTSRLTCLPRDPGSDFQTSKKQRNIFQKKKKKQRNKQSPRHLLFHHHNQLLSPAMSAESRDWSSLPELVLLEIIRLLLPCVSSLLAFAGVCRPWRHLLRSSSHKYLLSYLPPLLFLPSSSVLRPFPTRVSLLGSSLPFDPTLVCLGYSFGHVILLNRSLHLLHLADVITGGRHVTLPPLPPDRLPYYYAALTGPTSSSTASRLLVFYSKYEFFSCTLANPDPNHTWARHRLPFAALVARILPFHNRLFGITDQAHLLEFHFSNTNTAVQLLAATGPPLPAPKSFERWHFGPQLVAAGDKLLLLLFMLEPRIDVLPGPRSVTRVNSYTLDFAKMRWEEVKRLGEYSVFVDCGGKSAVACKDAASWGGRGTHLYVAGTGFDRWRGFRLDDETMSNAGAAPLSRDCLLGPRWPSPIWVYPSLFFYE